MEFHVNGIDDVSTAHINEKGRIDKGIKVHCPASRRLLWLRPWRNKGLGQVTFIKTRPLVITNLLIVNLNQKRVACIHLALLSVSRKLLFMDSEVPLASSQTPTAKKHAYTFYSIIFLLWLVFTPYSTTTFNQIFKIFEQKTQNTFSTMNELIYLFLNSVFQEIMTLIIKFKCPNANNDETKFKIPKTSKTAVF